MIDNNCQGYIITESDGIWEKPKILKDNKDELVIETILQEANTINRNRRKYSFKSLYDALINSRIIQEKLKRKAFVGEAG